MRTRTSGSSLSPLRWKTPAIPHMCASQRSARAVMAGPTALLLAMLRFLIGDSARPRTGIVDASTLVYATPGALDGSVVLSANVTDPCKWLDSCILGHGHSDMKLKTLARAVFGHRSCTLDPGARLPQGAPEARTA